MDMSMMAVDVDGTLGSPLILVLVLLYATGLAALTATFVLLWLRGGSSRLMAAVMALLFVLACVFNVAAVRAIAAAIIAFPTREGVHVGVGFFGSHPSWLAPALGIAAGLLVSARIRRVRAAVV